MDEDLREKKCKAEDDKKSSKLSEPINALSLKKYPFSDYKDANLQSHKRKIRSFEAIHEESSNPSGSGEKPNPSAEKALDMPLLEIWCGSDPQNLSVPTQTSSKGKAGKKSSTVFDNKKLEFARPGTSKVGKENEDRSTRESGLRRDAERDANISSKKTLPKKSHDIDTERKHVKEVTIDVDREWHGNQPGPSKEAQTAPLETKRLVPQLCQKYPTKYITPIPIIPAHEIKPRMRKSSTREGSAQQNAPKSAKSPKLRDTKSSTTESKHEQDQQTAGNSLDRPDTFSSRDPPPKQRNIEKSSSIENPTLQQKQAQQNIKVPLVCQEPSIEEDKDVRNSAKKKNTKVPSDQKEQPTRSPEPARPGRPKISILPGHQPTYGKDMRAIKQVPTVAQILNAQQASTSDEPCPTAVRKRGRPKKVPTDESLPKDTATKSKTRRSNVLSPATSTTVSTQEIPQVPAQDGNNVNNPDSVQTNTTTITIGGITIPAIIMEENTTPESQLTGKGDKKKKRPTSSPDNKSNEKK